MQSLTLFVAFSTQRRKFRSNSRPLWRVKQKNRPAKRQPCLDFEEYFQRTYVRRRVDQGGRQRYVDPSFKPALWNCHQAILQSLFRTNNASEVKFYGTGYVQPCATFSGWHYEFNGTCGTGRLAMDKFVDRLKLDEDKNRQRLVR